MFFLEGNIGTGKSTLLKKLEDEGIQVVYEPVNEWSKIKNKNGKNILEEFYTNQTRYAYTFQSIAFRTHIKNIKYSDKNSVVERSIFTHKNVFAKTCYENGLMNELEWNDYISWFEWLSEEFDIKSGGYIYLQADPKISYERITKRNRDGEGTITFDYINELHKKHEAWLLNEPNVLVLNVDEDFENNSSKLNEMIIKVKMFINNNKDGLYSTSTS